MKHFLKARNGGEGGTDRRRYGTEENLLKLSLDVFRRQHDTSASRQTLFSLLHRKQRTVREWRNREGSPERCLLTCLCTAACCSASPSMAPRKGDAALFDLRALCAEVILSRRTLLRLSLPVDLPKGLDRAKFIVTLGHRAIRANP